MRAASAALSCDAARRLLPTGAGLPEMLSSLMCALSESATGAATHDRLVAELCSAKVEVAELNERRDRARKKEDSPWFTIFLALTYLILPSTATKLFYSFRWDAFCEGTVTLEDGAIKNALANR